MSEPFLKWPGGKRWLAERIDNLLPKSYERYVEPFLGGGALFFRLLPRAALLTDKNEELINAYRSIATDAEELDRRLASLHKRHSEDLYYEIRSKRPTSALGRAVRFLYLNRTCFNGIYRVNLKGEFNVPIGSKNLVEYPKGYLKEIAESLQSAVIRSADFEATIDGTAEGDFIYIDPPYTVMHNNNNFVKYNSNLFSWDDQIRLSNAVKRATLRGVTIMLSNADHKSVRGLYRGFGHHFRAIRSSILAADSQFRRHTTELLVLNYKTMSPNRSDIRPLPSRDLLSTSANMETELPPICR